MLIRMADISEKDVVRREALAEGNIVLKRETVARINEKMIEKGDPIQVAILAGINAAKLTSRVMLLCHPIPLETVEVDCEVVKDGVLARSRVVSTAKTGVEMEALMAVTATLLNVWDVVKKYEKDATGNYPDTLIKEIRVIQKMKGKTTTIRTRRKEFARTRTSS
jgi:cyclic pyranopterin phosphate synthase